MSVTGRDEASLAASQKHRPASGTGPLAHPWQKRHGVLIAALVIVLAITIVRLAWYGDDWLITLRTVLNAAHGNGLRYNVDERVAAFTHPLWMMVVLCVGALSGSWVSAVIAVSVCLAVATGVILLVRARTYSATVAIGVALIVCNTVTVWSTGGLEGPLVALLVVCFVATSRWATQSSKRGFSWGMLAAGVYLTRPDAMILILPFMIYTGLDWRRNGLSVRWPALGLVLPIMAWSAFAWVYYGSMLPNTYEAKTNVAIPVGELIGQGWFYLQYSLGFDPGVWVPLVMAIVAWALTRSRVAGLLVVGALAYLAYVVWVAGDFMAGRFLYLPVIVALAALSEASRAVITISRTWTASMASGAAVLLLLGTTGSYAMTTDTNTVAMMSRGVVDERAFWVSGANTNLVGAKTATPIIRGMDPASLEAAADRWVALASSTPRTVQVEFAGIGLKGMQGPAVHILDQSALTDRFLAAQTFVPVPGPPSPLDPLYLSGPGWRVGHYVRPVPAGYVEALTWDDPERVVDPQLRAHLRSLWERIRP